MTVGAVDFGSTVGMLKNAMEGAGTAHDAIANNVVNAQTPGFLRTDVEFKSELAKAAGGPSESDELAMTATDPMHFDVDAPGEFDPKSTFDTTSRMRVDGSNVDLDQEMAKLSMNADYGNTTSQFLRNQYAMYRSVITE